MAGVHRRFLIGDGPRQGGGTCAHRATDELLGAEYSCNVDYVNTYGNARTRMAAFIVGGAIE